MSTCPHCSKRLRLLDWKPNCPHCGVNLMFYGFEERFYEDAKLSELSMAGMRAKMKRFKATLAGSRLAKLRLCIAVLPLVSLLLPMGSFTARLPFAQQSWQAGAMGIVNLVIGNKDALPYLRDMLDSPMWKALFWPGFLMLAACALSALFGVLVAVCSFLSFISLKHMSGAVGVLSIVGALLAVGGFAAGLVLLRRSAPGGIYSGALGFGAPLTFAMFLFTACANLLLRKKGVEVVYAEGDFERAEIYQKVKRGELKLADLPYPVVETEETRAMEAAIAKEMGGAEA